MGCHFFLQEIFLSQGSNTRFLHLLHWQADSLPLCPPHRDIAYLVANAKALPFKHLSSARISSLSISFLSPFLLPLLCLCLVPHLSINSPPWSGRTQFWLSTCLSHSKREKLSWLIVLQLFFFFKESSSISNYLSRMAGNWHWNWLSQA